MSNRVTVSDDGMEMTIRTGDHIATARSARAGGFTAEDIENARSFQINSKMIDGQANRVRRFRIGRRALYVHVNTGPPTWWYPRAEFRSGKAMAGWFRILVAISWERRK